MEIKLNIGCGTDCKEGFINIDGSDTLLGVDKVIRFPQERIKDHFDNESVSFILANDFIEHHYHWEAAQILSDFFLLLKKGGKCEIRVPDCAYIMRSFRFSTEKKITLLFGGQDVPQGVDWVMDESRKKYPEFFCHKYGWTRNRMKRELLNIGFSKVETKRAGTNFIAIAEK